MSPLPAQTPFRSPRALATEGAILDAALDCFAEFGFAGTSTRAVARRAGVTQPLLMHYFGTKDRLFVAVLERALRDYDELQADMWRLEPADVDFFSVGMPVLFRWLGSNPKLARLMRWARLEGRIVEVPDADALWQKVFRKAWAARSAGLLHQDLDIDASMAAIDCAFKGYWDRRDELAHAMGEKADTQFDRRMEKQLVTGAMRSLLRPEALDRALENYHAFLQHEQPEVR